MTEDKKRTAMQNRSLHSTLDLYAEKLNNAGYDYVTFLSEAQKRGLETPWTKESLKGLFNVIAGAMYNKSSSELTTKEMGECWRVFEHKIASSSGVNCAWRSKSQ